MPKYINLSIFVAESNWDNLQHKKQFGNQDGAQKLPWVTKIEPKLYLMPTFHETIMKCRVLSVFNEKLIT